MNGTYYIFREEIFNESSSLPVKTHCEIGNNGNGITPPDTPKRCSSPRNGAVIQKSTKTSSLITVQSEYDMSIKRWCKHFSKYFEC